VRSLAADERFSNVLAGKRRDFMRAETKKPLSLYRHEELTEMRQNFFGLDEVYHGARRDFVFKTATTETPPRLARHRQERDPAAARRNDETGVEPRPRLAAGSRSMA
jgi:putative two-component system protein, hydrogenase maturation factor HypX/HoxX